jgi:hypothetical protein
LRKLRPAFQLEGIPSTFSQDQPPCRPIPTTGDKVAAGLPDLSHRSNPSAREFNVLALIKGSERYVFVYDDDSRSTSFRRSATMRPTRT